MRYCMEGKFGRGKFGELTYFEHWQNKVWQINRSANRLLIISTKYKFG